MGSYFYIPSTTNWINKNLYFANKRNQYYRNVNAKIGVSWLHKVLS